MTLLRRLLPLGAASLAATATLAAATPSAAAPSALPPVHHIWLVVLENESYDATFTSNPNPYLPHTLPALGNLLTHYYGIGHASLDNYIAMISGQAPAIATQADCIAYGDVAPGIDSPTAHGQAVDTSPAGCVYPKSVSTIADQLSAANLTWKGYMEDMGKDAARDAPTTCSAPKTPPQPDGTQTAEAKDQYATRHDPFMYFHSVIDSPACKTNVVNLASADSGLVHDLSSATTTPNLSFITPNLCNDGHDTNCKNGDPGGLRSVDSWLATYAPKIMASPAFLQDGMLVVTFDEAATSDSTSCCGEQSGPNTPAAGGSGGGSGGGRVGAIVVSPFVKPGTTTDIPYNHYSLLRSFEDILGVTTGGSDGKGHLGFAGQQGLRAFGDDVFTASPALSPRMTVAAAQDTTPAADSQTAPTALVNTAGAPGRAGGAGLCALVATAVLMIRRRRHAASAQAFDDRGRSAHA